MRKLLITTALSASLISGAALAETKFGGNIETTYTTGDTTNATAADAVNTEGFGTDIEITVSHSKALDNGWDFVAAFAIDESGDAAGTDGDGTTISRSNIQLSNKDMGLTVQLGSEGLQLGENYIVPAVGDVAGDFPVGGANTHYISSINNTDALAISYNTGFGTLQLGATPQGNKAKDTGDSAVDNAAATTGSRVEGSFGTKFADGAAEVFVAAAQGHANSHGGSAAEAGSGSVNFSERFAGASYNFGKGKVGVTRREANAGSAAATVSADQTATTTMLAAAFNLSDTVSIGLQDQTTESDAYTSDEEAQVISIGYNFGGVTFTLSKLNVDNDGGVSTTDADYLIFRTKTSF
jgi:hypothetical protein